MHPYSSIDVTAVWKKLRFILSVRSDFHITDSLLIAAHAFVNLLSNMNNSFYNESFACTQLNGFKYCSVTIFTNPSTRAGCDSRTIFKRSLTGLNSETSCLTKAGWRITGFIYYNGCEGILCLPQSSSITGASPSDSLVSYLDTHCGVGILPLRGNVVSVFYWTLCWPGLFLCLCVFVTNKFILSFYLCPHLWIIIIAAESVVRTTCVWLVVPGAHIYA